MRSTTSSTSSIASSARDGGGSDERRHKTTRRLAGGQEQLQQKPGAGLQSSILKAILVDPLPLATSPARLLIHRPPSISIADDEAAEEEEEEGKENGGAKRRGKDRSSSRGAEDDEVFEILAARTGSKHQLQLPQQPDPDQTIDVTMSAPLTPLSPATPTPSELTLTQSALDRPSSFHERRSLGAIKQASSFLDVTSASTSSSIFNRSLRPKSLALEELPDEWRAWLRACTDGDIDAAKAVLRKEPSILNWSPPLTGRLAGLHLAVRGNHVKMVTWLCLQGADVNQRTLSGYTPLHIAAQQTNRGMVNELRRLGADESRRDLFGHRYEHYASWAAEERHGHSNLSSKASFRSCVSGPSYESRRGSVRSRPPSIYSRDSMASAASSFGRNSSIRDTVRGFFRNTFKKAHSTEKLPL